MTTSLNNFDFLKFARDLLFIEDMDFYPQHIWKDFEEALLVFLTDEELSMLSYRYGNQDYCPFSISEKRKILSSLFARLRNNDLLIEMDSLLSDYEADFLMDGFVDTPNNKTYDQQEFTRSALANLGLEYMPQTLGDFSVDSMIGAYPVYVWKFREVSLRLRVLNNLLIKAAENGFGRFFVVVKSASDHRDAHSN